VTYGVVPTITVRYRGLAKNGSQVMVPHVLTNP
jgi:hypothetical protein